MAIISHFERKAACRGIVSTCQNLTFIQLFPLLLNTLEPMLSEEIRQLVNRVHDKVNEYAEKGLHMFASSSFQTHSIPMLHILHTSGVEIPIYFLNTGYHFPETIEYRDQLAQEMGLSIKLVSSPIEKVYQRTPDGKLMYASDPDRCCYFNKVLPLEPVLQDHEIWINGVRRDQTTFRKDLSEEENALFDTVRYHPMLDWNHKMIWEYRQHFNLPPHPLEEQGFTSVGCIPCTRSYLDTQNDRDGRWAGLKKTECGIHTELTKK